MGPQGSRHPFSITLSAAFLGVGVACLWVSQPGVAPWWLCWSGVLGWPCLGNSTRNCPDGNSLYWPHSRGFGYYVDTLLIVKRQELTFPTSILQDKYFIYSVSFNPSGKYNFHLKRKKPKAQRGK